MIELFFFLAWSTETKQEQLLGLTLDLDLSKQHGKKFNINYNLERHLLFWIIPISRWKIKSIHVQSLKSGEVFNLDGDLETQAKEVYHELKEKEN